MRGGVTILVSSGTARQLGRGFRLGNRGPRQVQGRSRFIDIYALGARQEPVFDHRTVRHAGVGHFSQGFRGFRRSR